MIRYRSVGRLSGLKGHLGRGLLLACLAPGITMAAGGGTPERIWSDELTGESYSDHTVSLGNHGTQVFCDTGYLDPFTRLYSTFDESGRVIWEREEFSGFGKSRVVASSESGDIHAVWRQRYSLSQNQALAEVAVYRSSDDEPFIEYTFDVTEPGDGVGYCTVSDDGRWVVAATRQLGDVAVTRFDTQSSNPNNPDLEVLVDHWGYVLDFSASSDGKRLYIGGNTSGTLVNLETGQDIYHQYYFSQANGRGHSLSGDGKTVAAPENRNVRIFRESNSNNQLITEFDPFTTTNQIPWETAISHDGDLVAAAYAVGTSYDELHVFAWRVSTGEQLLNFNLQTSGPRRNLPEALSMSSSGHRIVVGTTGDGSTTNPEIRSFELNASGTRYEPLANFNYPGSVLALDLSADGNHLAVSGIDTHVDLGLGSKVIELYELGSDFSAQGLPKQGQELTFEFVPPASTTAAFLLVSDDYNPMPFSIGTLYPDRQGLQMHLMATSVEFPASRFLSFPVQGQPGTTHYFQGYSLNPRHLSDQWLPVTTMP